MQSTLGRVVYDGSRLIQFLGGPGRLWFYVPAGTGEFTLSFQYFTGGGIVLRDPAENRVAGVANQTGQAGQYVPVAPIAVPVKPGQAGKWWYLSHDQVCWPPLGVSFEGIPAYVAVTAGERLVVKP